MEKDWNQHVSVFLCDNWKGIPKESEEMAPKWYKKDKLPFANMWPDDPLWLPKVLNGEKLHAEFAFDTDGKIEENNIKILEELNEPIN